VHLGHVVLEEVVVATVGALDDGLAVEVERSAIDVDDQRTLVLGLPVRGFEHRAVDRVALAVLVGEELVDGLGELARFLGMRVGQSGLGARVHVHIHQFRQDAELVVAREDVLGVGADRDVLVPSVLAGEALRGTVGQVHRDGIEVGRALLSAAQEEPFVVVGDLQNVDLVVARRERLHRLVDRVEGVDVAEAALLREDDHAAAVRHVVGPDHVRSAGAAVVEELGHQSSLGLDGLLGLVLLGSVLALVLVGVLGGLRGAREHPLVDLDLPGVLGVHGEADAARGGSPDRIVLHVAGLPALDRVDLDGFVLLGAEVAEIPEVDGPFALAEGVVRDVAPDTVGFGEAPLVVHERRAAT